MDISCKDVGFPYIEIDNFYNSQELELIWEEINFLYYDSKIEKSYGSAEDSEGNPLKTSRCIYLDEFYQDRRNLSNILTVSNKLAFNSKKIFSLHSSWFFKDAVITKHQTAFSYYENAEFYKSHTDAYYITCLFWTFKEPKKFTGGDFIFTKYNQHVELKNNRMVIFPSCIEHQVTPVYLDREYSNKKMGRVCITHFLSCHD